MAGTVDRVQPRPAVLPPLAALAMPSAYALARYPARRLVEALIEGLVLLPMSPELCMGALAALFFARLADPARISVCSPGPPCCAQCSLCTGKVRLQLPATGVGERSSVTRPVSISRANGSNSTDYIRHDGKRRRVRDRLWRSAPAQGWEAVDIRRDNVQPCFRRDRRFPTAFCIRRGIEMAIAPYFCLTTPHTNTAKPIAVDLDDDREVGDSAFRRIGTV
jgi:hypothetical protein